MTATGSCPDLLDGKAPRAPPAASSGGASAHYDETVGRPGGSMMVAIVTCGVMMVALLACGGLMVAFMYRADAVVALV